MGKRYDPHSDMCGCERCAYQAERENPQQVFDVVEDPDYRDDGSHIDEPATDWDDFDDEDFDEEDLQAKFWAEELTMDQEVL